MEIKIREQDFRSIIDIEDNDLEDIRIIVSGEAMEWLLPVGNKVMKLDKIDSHLLFSILEKQQQRINQVYEKKMKE